MKWTEADVSQLRKLAADRLPGWMIGRVMERPYSSISSKAAKLKISINGDPSIQACADYDGVIACEDCGGSVGLRYFPASRTGGSFHAVGAEKLIQFGILQPCEGGYRVSRS